MREVSPVDDECPTEGDDASAIAAAVVRHVYELSARHARWVTVDGAAATCNVATLAAALAVVAAQPRRE